jgi:phage FluMu protein Com
MRIISKLITCPVCGYSFMVSDAGYKERQCPHCKALLLFDITDEILKQYYLNTDIVIVKRGIN